ncbi:hypothetical protein ACIQVT_06515 [Streptomyces sp. NPDC100445]
MTVEDLPPRGARPFFVHGTLRAGGRHHDRFLRGRALPRNRPG